MLRLLFGASFLLSGGSFAAESSDKTQSIPVSSLEAKKPTQSGAMDLKALWDEARTNNPQLRQMRESYLSAN